MQLVTEAAEEEREYAENMPENMQASEKFDKAEEAADLLDEISEIMDDEVYMRVEDAMHG